MNKRGDFPENLCVRSRRGALSPGEVVPFERQLQTSTTLRAAFTLGHDFDSIDVVQAGDDEKIARFVNGALRARKRTATRGVRAKPLSPYMLAAAVFAFCAVAYGLRATWLPRRAALQFAPTASTQTASSRHNTRSPLNVPSETTGVAIVSDKATPAAELNPLASSGPTTDRVVRLTGRALSPTPLQLRPRPQLQAQLRPQQPTQVSAVAPETTNLPAGAAVPSSDSKQIALGASGPPTMERSVSSSATSLLRLANTARRQGHLDRAVALLKQLQRDFGASPEAQVSHVSLGKLLMVEGAAEQASREFSAYLSIGGPLEEEALLGRAQALGALGRSAEEKSTWETLLARFPASVYQTRARERLRLLGDATSR